MKNDDYASGSSECPLTQPIKLLDGLCMKTAVFLGLPTIRNNLRIL